MGIYGLTYSLYHPEGNWRLLNLASPIYTSIVHCIDGRQGDAKFFLAAIKFGVSLPPVYAVYDRRIYWRRQILAKTRNSPNIIARQNLLIYSSCFYACKSSYRTSATVKWTISLVIADNHFNFPQGFAHQYLVSERAFGAIYDHRLLFADHQIRYHTMRNIGSQLVIAYGQYNLPQVFVWVCLS